VAFAERASVSTCEKEFPPSLGVVVVFDAAIGVSSLVRVLVPGLFFFFLSGVDRTVLANSMRRHKQHGTVRPGGIF
jgi:hypothetical protein